jgi:hypothetical protein
MPCRVDPCTHITLTPPSSGHSMFHLTSKWRKSSLVKHFENGTNLLIPTTTQCKFYRVFSDLHSGSQNGFGHTRGTFFFLHKIWGSQHGESLGCGLLGYTIEQPDRWLQHCRNSEDGGTRLLQNSSIHLWMAWCHNSDDHNLTFCACFLHFCVQSENVV